MVGGRPSEAGKVGTHVCFSVLEIIRKLEGWRLISLGFFISVILSLGQAPETINLQKLKGCLTSSFWDFQSGMS